VSILYDLHKSDLLNIAVTSKRV